MPSAALVAYGVPLAFAWTMYVAKRQRVETESEAKRAEAREAGLVEPPTLHPKIDPALCMGCATCVRACPEGDILGVIDGKAELVEPANCIGHGACKTACPANAITLVFGTQTRGVELPSVDPAFRTNVPGVYIAGELGGMGLVRNAVEQGRQAIESICGDATPGDDAALDLVIVGCGPAGLAASLAAKEKALRFVTLEQEKLGGAVAHYPRGKLVMTAPFTLPLIGSYNYHELSKEELISIFEAAASKVRLPIKEGERVAQVSKSGDAFEVRTQKDAYRARAVLLALGRQGTPRKLGAPGEELSKVIYRLVDSQQYRGRRALVIGGGDSALEAACALAAEPGAQVTLSYRGDAFNRAKPANRKRLTASSCRTLLLSSVEKIESQSVTLRVGGVTASVANDVVIICAGGQMPTAFLRDIGVEIETKYGVP
ncbi:NAD(P)-binding domain-containing protein [Methylocystis parvus]|uniref:4Fe-4S dicluster domain-containing protein n=1 Tax=Methylocystis parvus TaxID=134 RepID=A0A6B8M770_9HYPH|nr:NAD(P)-binding domain-containing protein [Methylocystis parvus]QGM96660.1 4Fe-4S dicluster domain-containing protein [Methylocystis parvus]WBJ99479.1 NAD(P)-binding domain-containing protein [Methylocystis parvus OBBP]